MATKAVQGKVVSIYVDGINASPFLQEFEIDSQRDDTDVTPFESDSKEFITSAAENDVTLTGFYNGESDSLDALLFNSYGGTVDNVVTIFPGGTSSAKKCLLVPGTQVGMNVSAAADEQVALEADFKSALVPGDLLKSPVPVSATGAGTPLVGVATTTGLTANLHVLSLTGAPTSCVITVEMSADGTSWTPVLTFTLVVATAKGGYTAKTLKNLPINAQLQAKHTIVGGTTPSLNYVLAAGRAS
jgi:hypothetical protein